MTRYAVGMAVGLGLLIVPSLAQAQTTLLQRPWRGPFSNVTFGAAPTTPNPRPRLPMFTSRLPASPTRPTPLVVPDLPVPTPPCVMPVVPVDPSITPLMPIVTVDERLDPRFVKRVACQPTTTPTRPPRD